MSLDRNLARLGLVVIEVDDLIEILEQADKYTHWFGPSVSARDKLDSLIAAVKADKE